MAQLPLQPIPSFDPDTAVGASLATRWRTWLNDFDTFLVTSGITDKKTTTCTFVSSWSTYQGDFETTT